MRGWVCTNCGNRTEVAPFDPCPKCNWAVWEREERSCKCPYCGDGSLVSATSHTEEAPDAS